MRLILTLCLTLLGTNAIAQEMRTITDAAGRTVEIPVQAERIVGMHDQSITLLLLELDAPVVGSMSRIDDEGNLYMRAVNLFYGLDFENSGITSIGQWNAWDYEAMAGLNPDLIIAWEDAEADHIEKLELIGPVVLLPRTNEPFVAYRALAEAVGRTDKFEFELARHNALVEQARAWLPQLQGATYSKIQGYDGTLNVYAGYGGLTQTLEELGMVRTAFAQDQVDRGVIWGEEVSAEVLPQLQADYIIDTFSVAYLDQPSSAMEKMNDIFPTWCDVLTSCAEGRYIVLPREHSTGTDFGSLQRQIYYMVTHVGGRPSVAEVQ